MVNPGFPGQVCLTSLPTLITAVTSSYLSPAKLDFALNRWGVLGPPEFSAPHPAAAAQLCFVSQPDPGHRCVSCPVPGADSPTSSSSRAQSMNGLLQLRLHTQTVAGAAGLYLQEKRSLRSTACLRSFSRVPRGGRWKRRQAAKDPSGVWCA